MDIFVTIVTEMFIKIVATNIKILAASFTIVAVTVTTVAAIITIKYRCYNNYRSYVTTITATVTIMFAGMLKSWP